MKTLRLLISGTVQGVFFRKHIEEKAIEFNIRGFIRNLADGRVEVVIEGRDDRIEMMISACKSGSPQSLIKNVEIFPIKYQGFTDFKILRI
ncbi:MAG: acylphosphatase [Candidatus Nanoarchaeia archaeon]